MKAAAALLLGALTALQALDADALRDRLDSYLLGYEPQLSALVAEELLVQRDGPSKEASVTAAPDTKNRRIVSEVAFISLPGGTGWLGFRRAVKLNGKELPDAGPPLGVLLTDDDQDDYDQARLLIAESARLNLGLPRTTNLPNLPLEFLHRRNRFRLLPRLDGTERVRGVMTTRVVFLERSTPTLIKHPNGSDQPSVIRAWIDPRDGRLLRAEVVTFDRLNSDKSDNSLRVEFEPDNKLGLLVPVAMRETFPGDPGRGTSDARYTNYRRFTTSARIVQ
jgi:hypothetical protein